MSVITRDMTKRRRQRALLKAGALQALFVGLVVFPIAGCGKKGEATVSGRATYKNGTPLVNARILARSNETGKSAVGATNENGDFVLVGANPGDGVLAGTYNVYIAEDRGDPDNPRRPTIAAAYSDPAKSGLTFTVAAGEHTAFDISLSPR
jgi:hypothetical protein